MRAQPRVRDVSSSLVTSSRVKSTADSRPGLGGVSAANIAIITRTGENKVNIFIVDYHNIILTRRITIYEIHL